MIITAGYFNGLKTLADGSVKLEITTQELTSQTAGDLFGIRGKFLKVVLSEENVSEEIKEEIIKTDLQAPKKTGKSKSKRLRDVLYRVWEAQGSQGDSEAFYEHHMELITQHFIDKYLE